jgi:hypothetical protein
LREEEEAEVEDDPSFNFGLALAVGRASLSPAIGGLPERLLSEGSLAAELSSVTMAFSFGTAGLPLSLLSDLTKETKSVH